KRLLGVEVVTSAAVPEGQLIVVDQNAIASAVGPFEVFQSEHQYFEYDSIAIRATWRIGWAVQHADLIAVVNVGTEAYQTGKQGRGARRDHSVLLAAPPPTHAPRGHPIDLFPSPSIGIPPPASNFHRPLFD